jgi:8-oxo-dGTP pyrophosphatase MutT (NUDIX family)
MKPGKVRSIAICVFYNAGRILVAEGYDHIKKETFYRPLGGTIEFGELSTDTIRRELREEIDAQVVQLRFLGALENIFTYNNQKGHEIVLVYDGQFSDLTLYSKTIITGSERDQIPFKALWMSLAEFEKTDGFPLYPTGLLKLLRDHK